MPIPPPDLTAEPTAVRDAVYAVVLDCRWRTARERALRSAPAAHRERIEALVVYDLACAIALTPDRDERRRMLEEAPAQVRDRVEAEARRLWRKRQGG